MNNARHIIPENLSAQEIAGHQGKTTRGIRKRADKENWPFTEEPNRTGGGIQKLYVLSSLPEDIQHTVQNQYTLRTQESPVTPAKTSNTTPADELPEWADEKAHARFNLVKALMDEKDAAKDRGENKTEAVKNFIEAYNNGLIFPSLHKTLGAAKRSTLSRWEKELKESGMDYRALAPKWGRHRGGESKLTEAEKIRFEIELLNDKKIKVETAIYHTKVILEHEGSGSPSGKAAFRTYAKTIQKRLNHVWTLMRKGEKALVDEVLPYLIRDVSKIEVGDVLVADGHRCSFTAIDPFTGRPARPLLIVFYDWKSGDIAGAYIDFQENVQVIHNALRNAIINLGKIPKFVYLDNGRAFKARFFTEQEIDFRAAKVQGVYARLGIKTIFAKPYNARAKVVERFFKEFESSFSRHQRTFVGTCIDDKPAGMNRNEDFTASLNPRKDYALEDVYQAMAFWHQMFYRSREHPILRGKTKGEVFDAGRGPGVDESELHFLMMNNEIKKIYPNGVKMLGAFYWHESLYGLRDKVVVKYDLNDISKIHVYLAATGESLCTAKRWQEVHPIARHTGSPKDQAELNRQLKLQAGLKRDTKKLAKRIKESHGNFDTFGPLLNELNQPALPETIEVPGNPERPPETDYSLEDVQALSGYEAPQEETQTEPESTEVFHASAIDKYEYLVDQDRDLTAEEMEWIENEFYPTASGQMVLQTEGRKIQGGKSVKKGRRSPKSKRLPLNKLSKRNIAHEKSFHKNRQRE